MVRKRFVGSSPIISSIKLLEKPISCRLQGMGFYILFKELSLPLKDKKMILLKSVYILFNLVVIGENFPNRIKKITLY